MIRHAYVIMSPAKARALKHRLFMERGHLRMQWGHPLVEKAGVVNRRAVFCHPFKARHLKNLMEMSRKDPDVRVRLKRPANWKHEDVEQTTVVSAMIPFGGEMVYTNAKRLLLSAVGRLDGRKKWELKDVPST